jgi:hypothetical protein
VITGHPTSIRMNLAQVGHIRITELALLTFRAADVLRTEDRATLDIDPTE